MQTRLSRPSDEKARLLMKRIDIDSTIERVETFKTYLADFWDGESNHVNVPEKGVYGVDSLQDAVDTLEDLYAQRTYLESAIRSF